MTTLSEELTAIKECENEINHHCDGPVTPLVVIFRACRLARLEAYEDDVCADAALNVMKEYGWIKDL